MHFYKSRYHDSSSTKIVYISTVIDNFRYCSFVKSTRFNKAVKLSTLPATSSAAQQHLSQVYYEVQKWLENDLNPEDWEWMTVNESLESI